MGAERVPAWKRYLCCQTNIRSYLLTYTLLPVAFVYSCAPADAHANNSKKKSHQIQVLHDLSQTCNLFTSCFMMGMLINRHALRLASLTLHLCCFKGSFPQRRQNGLLCAICSAGQSQGTRAPRFFPSSALRSSSFSWRLVQSAANEVASLPAR